MHQLVIYFLFDGVLLFHKRLTSILKLFGDETLSIEDIKSSLLYVGFSISLIFFFFKNFRFAKADL